MTKLLRFLKYFFLILLLGAVLSAGTFYIATATNKEQIPQLVAKAVESQTGAFFHFSRYDFKYISHFPFLSLELGNVVLRDSNNFEDGRDLLRIQQLSIQLHPLPLLDGQIEIKSLELDSARVRLFRSADGKMNNRIFRKEANASRQSPSDTSSIFSIRQVKLNGFDFEYVDSLRGKAYRVDLGNTTLSLNDQGAHQRLRIRGNWFFKGLVFNFAKGGYLKNSHAKADIRATLDLDKDVLTFHPSDLKIEGHDYDIEGRLNLSRPAFLELKIHNAGIPYEAVLDVLTKDLQETLGKYQLDGEVRADMHLAGALEANHPIPIDLKFSTRKGRFESSGYEISQLSLQGHYLNYCDSTRRAGPDNECVFFQELTGQLFGFISAKAELGLLDLKDPVALLDASLSAPLTELSRYLPPGMFDIQNGMVDIRIHHEGKVSTYAEPPYSAAGIELEGSATVREGDLRIASGQLDIQNLEADLLFDARTLWIKKTAFLLEGNPIATYGRVNNYLSFILSPDRSIFADLQIDAPVLQVDHFLGKRTPRDRPRKKNPSGLSGVTQLAEVVHGLLRQGEADLKVHSRLLTYKDFEASDVSFRSRLLRSCDPEDPGTRCLLIEDLEATLLDAIPLEADLTITNPQDPFLVMNARIDTELEALRKMISPDKLQILGGSTALSFRYKGKMEDYFDLDAAVLNAELNGQMQLRNASLDYPDGPYHLRDIEAGFHFDEKDLLIDSLILTVNQTEARATGRALNLIPFVFLPDLTVEAELEVYTPNLDLGLFSEAPAGQNPRPGNGPPSPTYITQIVEGFLENLKARLSITADELHYRTFQAEDVLFKSRFLDTCRADTQLVKCVAIDQFQATLFDAIPLEATLFVQNLNDPTFEADAQVKMPLTDLNDMFPDHKLVFHGGTIDLAFHYYGKPRESFDPEYLALNAQLNGRAKLENAAFDYVANGYRIEDLQSTIEFDQQNLYVPDLQLKLNQNPLQIEGEINDFTSFLFIPDRTLDASFSLKSPRFDIGQFSAPKKRENIPIDRNNQKTVITEVVDSALQQLNATLNIDAEEVRYEQFEASQVQGTVEMDAERVAFQDIAMSIGGGQFLLNGSVSELKSNRPRIDIQAHLEQNRIKDLFFNFDDFGQSGITHENIRGVLTADVQFRARANSNYDLLPETMRGQAMVKVVDGELLNLPLLTNINSFLFKNRDMANVQFATLENTFHLQGRDMIIDQFKVFSSVFSFSVRGLYCFQENTHTNLLFEVPVSNLWKKDLRRKTLRRLKNQNMGWSLLLRATKKEDQLKVQPVLFPKKGDRMN